MNDGRYGTCDATQAVVAKTARTTTKRNGAAVKDGTPTSSSWSTYPESVYFPCSMTNDVRTSHENDLNRDASERTKRLKSRARVERRFGSVP